MSVQKLDCRIVLVTRPTRLENILVKENTISQARFKIKSLNARSQEFSQAPETNTDFELYEVEHNQYQQSILDVRKQLSVLAPLQVIDRKYLPNFVFAETDIVICIGQDGLVANTIKYLNGQSVIGINPDKKKYDGILLPFESKDAIKIVQEVFQGKREKKIVRMAEALLPDGQSLLAVNDFFIGQRGHASAQYIIKYNGVKEPQLSSGVIISTGLGSTGWMKSVIAGARGIASAVIGRPYGSSQENESLIQEDEKYKNNLIEKKVFPSAKLSSLMCESESIVCDEEVDTCCLDSDIEKIKNNEQIIDYMCEEKLMDSAKIINRKNRSEKSKSVSKAIRSPKKEYGYSELSKVVGKWESEELIFAVREPFSSKTSGTSIVFGKISSGQNLRIESLMGENGVIFSDGIESDYLEFNSGMEVRIDLAKKVGHIIV